MSLEKPKPPSVAGRWIFASIFLVAGVSHFTALDFFLKVMPPYLPYPRELVQISGAIEIVLGLMLLFPRTSRLAAWGLITLLIAVFPANVHVFLRWNEFPPPGTVPVPGWVIWLLHLIRLPVQGLLIYWAYAYTRTKPGGVAVKDAPSLRSELEG